MFNRQSFLIKAIALIGFSSVYKFYQNSTVYLVHAQTENVVNLLHGLETNFKGIDSWDRVDRFENTSYPVMVPPEVNNQFDNVSSKNKIESFENIDEVENKVMVGEARSEHGNRNHPGYSYKFDHFWKYDEVNNYLNYLKKSYSRDVKLYKIGRSEQKRTIFAIRIWCDRRTRKGKLRVIIIDATMHANEWISTMMAMYIIRQLVVERAKNSDLLNNIVWYIVPIVNPDGFIYSHDHDQHWKKTRTKNANSNCIGVDLSRNFDIHWDMPGGASADPCKNYRGPKAHSTPEARHFSKVLRVWSRHTILYMNLHSSSNLVGILYPYAYTSNVSIYNHFEHQNLGDKMSEAISNRITEPIRYKVVSAANVFLASGESIDYAFIVAKIPMAFKMLLPGGDTVKADSIEPIVNGTFYGFKVLGEYFARKI